MEVQIKTVAEMARPAAPLLVVEVEVEVVVVEKGSQNGWL